MKHSYSKAYYRNEINAYGMIYLFGRGLDPWNDDTDNDGLKDGVEVKTGVWSNTVVSAGVYYYTSPLSNDTDGDGCFDKFDPVPLDYDMDADGYINCFDIINPKSSYYVSRLVFPVNHDPNLKRDGSGNLIVDSDMDNDGTINSNDADDDNDGMTDSYEISYGVANSGWQNPYIYNQRFAILICGGSTDSGKNFPALWNDIKKMYYVLKDKYKYDPENIFVHRWDKKGGSHDGSIYYTGPAGWWIDEANRSIWGDGISQTFDKITPVMTNNDFLYLMAASHGMMTDWIGGTSTGAFVGYNPMTNKETSIAYNMSDIKNLRYDRAVFVFAACGSGSAITGTNCDPDDNLKGSNRIIITSCNKDEYGQVTPLRDHIYFLWHDWASNGFVYKYAKSGYISVETAYQSGVDAEEFCNPWWHNHPKRWEDDTDASYTYL